MGHSSRYPTAGLCEVCVKGKQTRLQYTTIPEERKAKGILEVVSTDVCGLIDPPKYNGERYFVTFLDHYSHFCLCYLIKKKGHVL